MILSDMTDLYPYQQSAIDSVEAGWTQWARQLGVAATGAGKTVIFAHLAARQEGRTVVLAHREQLVSQAEQQLHEAGALESKRTLVTTVQAMRNRLYRYSPYGFDLVICDEAHHSVSDEWQTVLRHFNGARVLGMTATPDRQDRRHLGSYYQNVAFEIGLLELITTGYLCPLRAFQLPVKLDARHLRSYAGDITVDTAAELITPHLRELAEAVAAEIWDRKALVFLPRIDVSIAFAAALCRHRIAARPVFGLSEDREDALDWFDEAGPGCALCNAMLLTEGYDCPSIDCIVPLRPTKSRSLYMQMIGRGTRLHPGKQNCTLIDPLWLSDSIDICRPADLIAPNTVHRDLLQRRLEEGLDLVEAEKIAQQDVEEALARQLVEAQRNRKPPRGYIDPLAWAVGIHDSNLMEWEATMPWHEEPPTEKQWAELQQCGLWTERVTRGFAVQLLERIAMRDKLGLATPKQVALLRRLKEPNADTMTRAQAAQVISQLRS
jgi:superfamily II DNA or RNA helicase